MSGLTRLKMNMDGDLFSHPEGDYCYYEEAITMLDSDAALHWKITSIDELDGWEVESQKYVAPGISRLLARKITLGGLSPEIMTVLFYHSKKA